MPQRRFRLTRRPEILSLWCVALALMLTGCKRVPSDIIQPHDMASLMADIHIGESVADQNAGNYTQDSLKRLLKQSILAKHGVDTNDFDTALMWYGHHLDKFQDVYDETIEILEKRLEEAKATEAGVAMAIAGDSVDVWTLSRRLSLSPLSPSHVLAFSLPSDSNWEPGDAYSWRFKTINNSDNIYLRMMVDYEDGTTETTTSTSNTDGWQNIHLSLDSLRKAVRIYGIAQFTPPAESSMYADSISLVRSRVNPIAYGMRNRVKLYGPRDARLRRKPLPVNQTADSTNVNKEIPQPPSNPEKRPPLPSRNNNR